MSKLEHLTAEGLLSTPTYSQVVVASGRRTIYVSGQVPVDQTGAVVGAGDLGAQTTQAMHNLGLVEARPMSVPKLE